MNPHKTLLLTHREVTELMSFQEYMDAVESAFRSHAQGLSIPPELMHLNTGDGEFHVKGGGLLGDKGYVALKVGGGFFRNPERFGLPSIVGLIALFNATNGYPLAVMDSREITKQRTGAVTAVAAKYFARKNSKVVTICGCGNQGRIQLTAVCAVCPIEKVYAFSINKEQASDYANEMSQSLGVPVQTVENLDRAIRASDVLVTCTPSKKYFVRNEAVAPGTFISAIGADSPDKQELDPKILIENKVIVDILSQCARAGELHHAIELGMPISRVHGELGALIAGMIPGREFEDEIIIFDSTGTALQDVAAAARIYERAMSRGIGLPIDLLM